MTRSRIAAALCALIAMAAAVLVRLPAVRLSGLSEEQRAAYTTESGLPYLTDPDSYYHVRITDNYLDHGTLGDSVGPDGSSWDSRRYAPEGRSADYQPGIAVLTAGVWRVLHALFGTELYAVEYWLSTAMAALAAAAAFLLAFRAGGPVGGLAAGLLTACSSVFVLRTAPGRFDTDMFVVLLDTVLLLLLTETLRARTRRGRGALAVGFAAATLLYTQCWYVYSLLLAALAAAGGAAFLLFLRLTEDRSGGLRALFRRGETRAFLLAVGLTLALVLIGNGPAYLLLALKKTTDSTAAFRSDELPNLFVSVNELRRGPFGPARFAQWFSSYVPGEKLTPVNGVGGLTTLLLCLGALGDLWGRALRRPKPPKTKGPKKAAPPPPADDRLLRGMYACVLGVFLLGCLAACTRGVRFVEHLAVPVGILAGMGIDRLVPAKLPKAGRRAGLLRAVLALLLCAGAAAPVLAGAVRCARGVRPSMSDSYAEAMAWVRENAADPDAVIASWWDKGYCFEAASGHPALWDGGSQTGQRAVLVARALTEEPETSAALWELLACSGDAPASYLAERLGTEAAYEAIQNTLLLSPAETAARLETDGLTPAEAAEAAALLHPAEPREVYVVLASSMQDILGWFEYYAEWDFGGENPLPQASRWRTLRDGSGSIDSDDPAIQARFDLRRAGTFWRLWFDEDGGGRFTRVFDQNDGVTRVQLWRVETGGT